ncbi:MULTISPECIES: GntR family transcriptional regulator [unclassified Caballeronia]|uniref:GntR family transcriptional regulator n=1 Tax=unclassified Caballeronia TaxID=2646786 RepID=UPI001F25360D|nr:MULTISPECIES: GntR family transcriptional regulator [unclassified Caballeronia]MCE4546071.1 GntR family transcriptional regulator [Caballeronia sp. PC1]MCE4573456.1 GntR family transcriptional regulator [Caballeronia sp. CLC5]
MPNFSDSPEPHILDAPQPRHLDLARTLMQDICDGRFAIGELLPTEAELCAKWGLSRYAVRQAIQKLCGLGLITRQAGVGTTVVADRPQTRYVQAMDSLSDLALYAKGTCLRVNTRSTMQADAAQAALLRCATGSKWLHLEGVRYGGEHNDEPIALVNIYVDSGYSRLTGLSKTLDKPVYTMIEEQHGIKVTRVEQQIQGLLIEGPQADLLQVKQGSAGLGIVRSYFVRDKVIEVTTGVHPASRFSYSMSFQLTQSTA